jgi:hypothetical protein
LAGVRNFYIARGVNHPLQHPDGSPFLKLQLVLKGIRKAHCKPSSHRLPITVQILKALSNTAKNGVFGPYRDLLMRTACAMAFFGFLRCGEFTCQTNLFDPSVHLCFSDVTILHQDDIAVQADVLLRASKTDPFRQGCTIHLFSVDSELCPVQLLAKFYSVRRRMNAADHEPFFILPDGQPLTRYAFLSMLKALLRFSGLADLQYSGHSFRIGAATTAASAHIPDHLIKLLGRWSSDCYQRYIHTPPNVLRYALNVMADV